MMAGFSKLNISAIHPVNQSIISHNGLIIADKQQSRSSRKESQRYMEPKKAEDESDEEQKFVVTQDQLDTEKRQSRDLQEQQSP